MFFPLLHSLIFALSQGALIQFPQGQLQLTLDLTKIQEQGNLMTLQFQLQQPILQNDQTLVISLPTQIQQQDKIVCGLSGLMNGRCELLQGSFYVTFSQTSQNFTVKLLNFQNPISNFTSPMNITLQKINNSSITFSLTHQLRFDIISFDNISIQLSNSTTFLTQELLVNFDFPGIFPQDSIIAIIADYGLSSNIQAIGMKGLNKNLLIVYSQSQVLISNLGTSSNNVSFKLTNYLAPYCTEKQFSIQVRILDLSNGFISAAQFPMVIQNPNKLSSLTLVGSEQRTQFQNNISIYACSQFNLSQGQSLKINFPQGFYTDSLVTQLIKQDQFGCFQYHGLQIQNPLLSNKYLFNVSIISMEGFLMLQNKLSKIITLDICLVPFEIIPDNRSSILLTQSTKQLNAIANISLLLQLQNSLSNNGAIVIQLPSNLMADMTQTACGQMVPQLLPTSQCKVQNDILTIQSVEIAKNVTVQLRNVRLPNSACRQNYFSIMLLKDGSLVEQSADQATQLKLEGGTIQSDIKIQSSKTNAITNYAFNITLQNAAEKIVIQTPSSNLKTSCTVDNGSCITLDKEVQISDFSGTQVIILLENVQNPRQEQKMEDFQFNSYIGECLIDTGKASPNVYFESNPIQMSVLADNYEIYNASTWTIKISTPNWIQDTDYGILSLPVSVQQNTRCQNVICEILNPNTIKLLGFSPEFAILNLQNQLSINQTRNWTLIYYNKENQKLAYAYAENQKWTQTQIQNIWLSPITQVLEQNKRINISFQNKLKLNQDTYIQIQLQEGSLFNCIFDGVQIDCNNGTYLSGGLSMGNHTLEFQVKDMENKYSSGLSLKIFNMNGDLIQQFSNQLNLEFTCAEGCDQCFNSHDNCSICSNGFALNQSKCIPQTLNLDCNDNEVNINHQCVLCKTNQANCIKCETFNISTCNQCRQGFVNVQGTCLEIQQFGVENTTQTNSSNNGQPNGQLKQQEKLIEVPLGSKVQIFTPIICIIWSLLVVGVLAQKIIYKQTEGLLLFYSIYSVMEHFLELGLFVYFLVRLQTAYGLGCLGLIIVHIVGQIYFSIIANQHMMLNPDFISARLQSQTAKLIYIVSLVFDARLIMMLLCRCSSNSIWNGPWSQKLFILKRLNMLVLMQLFETCCFISLMVVAVVCEMEIQMFYIETLIVEGLYLFLSGFVIYLLRNLDKTELKQADLEVLEHIK